MGQGEEVRLTIFEQPLCFAAQQYAIEQASIRSWRQGLSAPDILGRGRRVCFPRRGRRLGLVRGGTDAGQGARRPLVRFARASIGSDLVAGDGTGTRDRKCGRRRCRCYTDDIPGVRSGELAELEPGRVALTLETLGLASVADGSSTVTLATLLAARPTGRVW